MLAVLDDAQIRAREQQSEAMVRQAEARLRLSQHQVTVLGEQLRQSEIGVGQARADAEGRVNEAEGRLAAAEAQLAQAVAAHAQAKWERDAYTRLVQKGYVAEQDAMQKQYTEEAQAAVVSANRRQVEAARGAVTTAKANLDNPAIRSAQVAAIQAQILQAQADIAASQADAERARAALDEARANRADLQVIAPFTGTVATRTAEPGEVVTPGTPIVTMVNLGQVYLRAFVPGGDIGRVRVGQPARVYLDSAPNDPDRRPGDPDRSRGVVHAGEHVLPRGPREAGRRGQAADQRRARLRQAGHARRRRDPRRRAVARAPGAAMSAAPAEPAIRIAGLAKRYGALEAVRGIDLEVRAGEIFGLIGPDGAGKTSTFQVLGGVMEATAGTAELLGRPAREARSYVGYLTQAFSLYPDLSVEENLRYVGELRLVPRAEIERRGRRYLEMFGMARFGRRLAGRLSGGMKQKMALACALVAEPRVLLLDEPTTGVDPVSRREFWDALVMLSSQGMTILVATPYLDEAERCHRVALMHQGQLVRTGTPAEIRDGLGLARLEVRAPDLRAALTALSGRDGGIADVQRFGDRLDVMVRDPAEGERRCARRSRRPDSR